MGWVAGDKVYGGNPKLRSALEERKVGYVLAVACSAEVTTGAGKLRAKGHRFYDWAVIDLAEPRPGSHRLNSPTTAAGRSPPRPWPHWSASPPHARPWRGGQGSHLTQHCRAISPGSLIGSGTGRSGAA